MLWVLHCPQNTGQTTLEHDRRRIEASFPQEDERETNNTTAMCGIAGLLNLKNEPLADNEVVRAMASTLVHRGPDDDGYFSDGPVAFGFRRLSIIDLTTGHQPLCNEDRTVWVMFNGEIYNYVELHDGLRNRGHVFQTKSDTEVIAHSYDEYGADFVRHLRGMFAIALWDAKQRRLYLVRDRIGEKPLFYGVRNGQLAFASEIKALMAWPGNLRAINHEALHDYLTLLYVPSPKSILDGIHKLPPAHMLIADCNSQAVSLQRYWSVPAPTVQQRTVSYYMEGLANEMREAVRIRLRSDVPLGAFLSGGIDSTIVAGLMVRENPHLKTFSIGFTDQRYDESAHARLVADTIGAAHSEEIIDAESMVPEDLCNLVWYMDEPFGDSSFIPTYWVSKTARQYVTVALSGDGGDELFGGYPRYRYYRWLDRLSSRPGWVRSTGRVLSRGLMNASLPIAPTVGEYLRQAEKAFEISALDEDGRRLALLSFFNEEEKRRLYSERWREQARMLRTVELIGRCQNGHPARADGLSRIMARDVETNLVDDSLVKVDRASMACSLEVRTPFLDHRVVEFAMQIPTALKLHNGVHKFILKETFRDLIPPDIMRRKKHGFELPFARWFQKPQWRSLITDMLSEERMRAQGIFNPTEVVGLRDTFLADPEAHHLALSAYQLRHRVWSLLMFQLWYERLLNVRSGSGPVA